MIQLAAEVCSLERIFEPAADVPAPQIQETIRDVIQHASQIRKTGHDVTHLAPQLHTAGCIFDAPVPQTQETILDASQLVPQACSPECIVQQTAVLPSAPVVNGEIIDNVECIAQERVRGHVNDIISPVGPGAVGSMQRFR